ncbi:1-(5-phosphoribosyl)-5-[(5-phosphoribosylamino)methylideneamino]imidazole-4-carboxamide isomerase [Virgibacillus salexigens]|uniref:1-(5-phosphoribosyl)-5-[(5-phosphoribosylamino)methylideneamino] imidazole-4-carboxamide isomerase n=1 Tax=Virgibacillus kapii TaxID=1638645 RepID=A0ABQ2DPB3_9BACI|nr:1-(5-phosphoribosyl)-5-[(5-phosphoribosylamino)methylideneamino]imidazole-4-carboxamide isomerase [Virgibacillus kapii]GGJ66791.1 1-(5-phosphoribosyl)-5-[(5-phosphoribosylamino) methylideneamino] imidazole-4-carboxamide isomerase [Virgibacillus kapii]
MILFPAIDIKNGKCVRLTQGNYRKEKIYSDSPVSVAKQWEEQGAAYLHLVDLDGAKSGLSINADLIKEIAKQTNIPIQIGGGIRSITVMEDYLNAGVDQVILGTAAVKDKQFLETAVKNYPTQTAVSIDARNGFVATNGWTETSKVEATEIVGNLEDLGLQTLIYTDILKDGMLQGPNLEELENVNNSTSMNIIASGGVTTLDDIVQLNQKQLYGAIIGKALYDGSLSLKQGLELISNAG